MNIFITGITGFIGKEFLSHLKDDGRTYYCLVRSRSMDKFKGRVKGINNIVPVQGDLLNPNLVDDENELFNIQGKIEKVLHAAALYDLKANKEDCYLHNVVGTQNVVNFAEECLNLKEFHYVSTIAVAGNYEGPFSEEDFDKGQGFSDFYSETKYIAEDIIRNHLQKCKRVVYRPGIVLGNSNTGEIGSINGPYYLFEFLNKKNAILGPLKRLPFLPFPFDENSKFPVIPVDHLAREIYKLVSIEVKNPLETIHLISKNSPTVKLFLSQVLKEWGFKGEIRGFKQNKFNKFLFKGLKLPLELEHYLYSKASFELLNYEDKYNDELSDYNEYSNRLIGLAKTSVKRGRNEAHS